MLPFSPRRNGRSNSTASSDSRRDSGISMKNDEVTQPSKRLYERLGALSSDPSDPESVADVTILAFGAFERYYVCWRNQGGEYRQDSYNLPPLLHEWLFPPDGGTRHLPSLSVVLGRGDEFFASDENGKIDSKDFDKPDPVLHTDIPSTTDSSASSSPIIPSDTNGTPRVRASSVAESIPIRPRFQQAVRRARTMSLVRPSADPAIQAGLGSTTMSPVLEVSPWGRKQQQQQQQPQQQQQQKTMPVPESHSHSHPPQDNINSIINGNGSQILHRRGTSRPRSIIYSTAPQVLETSKTATITTLDHTRDTLPTTAYNNNRIQTETCSCPSCGSRSSLPAPPPPTKPQYVDSSCQTDLLPPAPPALTIPEDHYFASTLSITPESPPVVVNALGSYFRTGGYQLGDALANSYQPIYYEEVIYEGDEFYGEEFGEGHVVVP